MSNSLRHGAGRDLHGLAVRELGSGEASARTPSADLRPAISLSTESPTPYDTLSTLLSFPHRRYRSRPASQTFPI